MEYEEIDDLIFNTILIATESDDIYPDRNIDIKMRIELMVYSYAFYFTQFSLLVPKYEAILWDLRRSVFGKLIEFSESNIRFTTLGTNAGNYINSRAVFHNENIKNNKQRDTDYINHFANILYENPLTERPIPSKNTTNSLLTYAVIGGINDYSNFVVDNIVQDYFNLGDETIYNNILNENKELNPHYDVIKFVLINSEENKQLCNKSELTGGFPSGKTFVDAALAVPRLKLVGENLLIGSFIVFDCWINLYRDRYGPFSIDLESILFIERQIVRYYQWRVS